MVFIVSFHKFEVKEVSLVTVGIFHQLLKAYIHKIQKEHHIIKNIPAISDFSIVVFIKKLVFYTI